MNPRFFAMLRSSGFRGPITMQFEYPFENASLDARVRALRADNAQLRAWLKTVSDLPLRPSSRTARRARGFLTGGEAVLACECSVR